MWSKFKGTIIGLMTTIVSWFITLIALLFLFFLMYLPNSFAVNMFFLASSVMFIGITVFYFRKLIRQIKTSGSYSYIDFIVFMAILISIFCPFACGVELGILHLFGTLPFWFTPLHIIIPLSFIFFIYGIILDIIEYRINKKHDYKTNRQKIISA
ncbi:MAG: hypothetical protein KF900_01175 [Bacteroidetes bacterium]|nr:hypothetical protein [Bacteroidota bacterium]